MTYFPIVNFNAHATNEKGTEIPPGAPEFIPFKVGLVLRDLYFTV
jgi:hypothetical protein